jgi:1,2-phenylacetyl-CoA epoxidase catalytic subunit
MRMSQWKLGGMASSFLGRLYSTCFAPLAKLLDRHYDPIEYHIRFSLGDKI